VAAADQVCGELFDGSFDTAVGRRDSAQTDHGHAQPPVGVDGLLR